MEALAQREAMRRIGSILERGTILHSIPIAHEELESARVSRVDCVNVLRSGVVAEVQRLPNAVLYHVRTVRFSVAVEILSESELLVRTAWRVAP
jgi:hypothetical protein